MAEEKLMIDILLGKNNVGKSLTDLEKQIQNLGRLSAKGFLPMNESKQAMKELGQVTDLTKSNVNQLFKEGTKMAHRFDASMLTLLFTGMALSRAFGGITRGITNTFAKSEDETSGLSQATTRLAASWEFFKFSLMEALNTPFFIGIIDGVVGLINTFSQMADWKKQGIVIGSAMLAGLGTVLTVAAQVKLFTGAGFGSALSAALQTNLKDVPSEMGKWFSKGFKNQVPKSMKDFTLGDAILSATAAVTLAMSISKIVSGDGVQLLDVAAAGISAAILGAKVLAPLLGLSTGVGAIIGTAAVAIVTLTKVVLEGKDKKKYAKIQDALKGEVLKAQATDTELNISSITLAGSLLGKAGLDDAKEAYDELQNKFDRGDINTEQFRKQSLALFDVQESFGDLSRATDYYGNKSLLALSNKMDKTENNYLTPFDTSITGITSHVFRMAEQTNEFATKTTEFNKDIVDKTFLLNKMAAAYERVNRAKGGDEGNSEPGPTSETTSTFQRFVGISSITSD